MKQPNIQAPVALITGAARRIGAAIAQHLWESGFRVVIHYHQSAKEACALVQSFNHQRPNSALAIQANLNEPTSAALLVKETINWSNRLDLLVNNASLFKRTRLDEFNEADWRALFTIHVEAPFRLSQAAYLHLKQQQGAIINITDIHAEKPLKEYAVYCQSKAALTMQTQSLAREFAPHVRVNAIAPGAILWPEHDNALNQAAQEKLIKKTPLNQHGKPIFIAQAVLSLFNNGFVTGQTLRVDGGRSVV